jgi:hypothetical protein
MILFQTPYSTLEYRGNITKTKKALRDEIKAKSSGQFTNFSVGKEKYLVASLKDLAGRAFGYTSKQICRTAFLLANLNFINYPWYKDKMCAG